MALLAALLTPLSLQVARTVAHTGNWSYVDSGATPWYMGPRHVNLNSALYAYDTIVPPWRGPDPTRPPSNPDLVTLYDGWAAGYDGGSCLKDSHTGLLPALRHGDLTGALCLLVKRQFFYFGSYARLGLVYLPSPDTRVWSRWLCVLNIVPLAVTRGRPRRWRTLAYAVKSMLGTKHCSTTGENQPLRRTRWRRTVRYKHSAYTPLINSLNHRHSLTRHGKSSRNRSSGSYHLSYN